MEASAAQQEKFDKFQRNADSEVLLRVALLVATLAGLERSGIGTRWGVTVCADKTSLIRLNVGNRILLDGRPDGMFQLMVVHSPDETADWADLVEAYQGFPQVENSLSLLVDGVDDLLELLEYDDIQEKIERHAEASGRSLPRPEWHNLLLDQLIASIRQGGNDDEWQDDEDDEDDDEWQDDGEEDDEEEEDDDEEDEDDDEEDEDDDEEDEDDDDDPETEEEDEDDNGGNRGRSGVLKPVPPSSPDDEVLLKLSGTGSHRTRPVEIPSDVEYATLVWSADRRDTRISIAGVPPTSLYESFRGQSGEGVLVDTGRVYLEVDSDAWWQLEIRMRRSGALKLGAGAIASFSGSGEGRTRPFSIPKGCEYFVVKWTTTSKTMRVEVNGIKPTESYDSFGGGSKGEGLVYEHGRFYAEVDTDGSWTLDVVVE